MTWAIDHWNLTLRSDGGLNWQLKITKIGVDNSFHISTNFCSLYSFHI